MFQIFCTSSWMDQRQIARPLPTARNNTVKESGVTSVSKVGFNPFTLGYSNRNTMCLRVIGLRV